MVRITFEQLFKLPAGKVFFTLFVDMQNDISPKTCADCGLDFKACLAIALPDKCLIGASLEAHYLDEVCDHKR